MKLLGDEKGVEKIKEAAAKVEKQHLKMEADRKRYEALEDQIQKEYNAKMAAVNARAAAVKDEMARKEQQRLEDQIAKGKAQAKAADKFEVDERKHALEKLDDEEKLDLEAPRARAAWGRRSAHQAASPSARTAHSAHGSVTSQGSAETRVRGRDIIFRSLPARCAGGAGAGA